MNPTVGSREVAVEIRHLIDPAVDVQVDEQWSFVQKKKNPRWLWYAIDAVTGVILAFVFGRRNDEACQALMLKLNVFNIRTYYTDAWTSYVTQIPEDQHVIGKRFTQKIENKNLNLRTRIKRLARKTICFSKSETMHDGVIGLFINQHCFQSS